MQYYTDQNPGILALHSSYRGLEGSSEAVPGIPAGCYRIVSYRTSLHPLRLPTVTTHAVPVTIPVPNPHGVPVSLSLCLSPSPRPFIIAGFSSFPVPLLFLFFSFLSFLFLSFLPQGFLATLPRHRSPFPFLLAATAGFWCPVSRPAPNGA